MPAEVIVEREALHALPRTQYGHFIEHLGKCIKGGIWAEGESEDMFLGGVRPELVEAIKSIHPALIRYPGGCFADGYHWQDGIGPRASRPSRRNRAWAKLGPWHGPREDNHFGTDEFLRLCEEVGAGPMLTANVGSGAAAEAAAWVEYCNGPPDSRWGGERARNGRAEPYGVKHWFVGNEIFGIYETGHRSPSQYARTFREFAQAMRRTDPDLKLIAVGNHAGATNREAINRIVLEGAGPEIDYLSIHQYVPELNAGNLLRYSVMRRHVIPDRGVYYDVMASVRVMEDLIRRSAKEAHRFSPPAKPVKLVFDEWNLWFDFLRDIVIANFNLRDGLWVATMLNLLHRFAPDVPIANIAQMVNCVGIIDSTARGNFPHPLGPGLSALHRARRDRTPALRGESAGPAARIRTPGPQRSRLRAEKDRSPCFW